MGLDIYMYRSKNMGLAVELENKFWNLYNSEARKVMTEEELDKLAEEHKYNRKEWQSTLSEKIELPSTKYPEHMFKIGYFRSSYNESGINKWLNDHELLSLYEMFDASCNNNTGYEVIDWRLAKANVTRTIDDYKKIQTGIELLDISRNSFIPRYEMTHQAIEQYFAKVVSEQRDDGFFDSYSNGPHEVFTKGLTIYGVTHTASRSYLVVKKEECEDWRLQALEIILETIDYVLAQPNPEEYFLVFSG